MRKEVIVHKSPKSPISEIFRTLRTNIQFMNTNKKMKTLLITSTFAEEGKSWVTSNLAVTFAQAGKKVILIDADMRKGRQYAIFGISPKPGLSNYLSQAGDTDIDEGKKENVNNYLQETEITNLHVITAGSVPPNPSELLVSRQMIDLLEQLKQLCDIIIIDGTPCELVTDSVILSRIVDSTIIVTAHKKTKKDRLKKIIQNIQNVGGNIAGVVLNRVPITNKEFGNQYYYYGSNAKKKRNLAKRNSNKKMKQFNERIDKNALNLSKEKNDLEKQEKQERQENVEQRKEIEKKDVKITETDTNEKNSDKDIYKEIYNKVNDNTENMVNEKDNNKQDTGDNNADKPVGEGDAFLNKTNEILKQINEYLDNEKKKMK